MFDKIFLALGKDFTNFSGFINNFEEVVSTFEKEYMKDRDLRDAAIDSIIDYLQTLKTQK